jgi:predicted Zn-dependent protease
LSNKSISYCRVLFYSFVLFLIAVSVSYAFAIAAEENNNDDDNTDEDFEEENTIQICCVWGHNMQDGILTYYIDAESSTKQQQEKVGSAIQEWDNKIDPLELKETSNKKNGDILIEFQEEYDGNERAKRVLGQSINTFNNNGFIDRVQITVYRGTSEYTFDEDIIQRIVEHEMGHALGLGHANFDGNLMAEKVNDGTENVSECEVKAVLKANYWKLIANGIEPVITEKNEILCDE